MLNGNKKRAANIYVSAKDGEKWIELITFLKNNLDSIQVVLAKYRVYVSGIWEDGCGFAAISCYHIKNSFFRKGFSGNPRVYNMMVKDLASVLGKREIA